MDSSKKVLDMSYNSIRSMAPVAHCPKLQELYLAQNKLRELSGLEGLTALQKLDVGGNRIRSLQPVAKCTGLVELWAGKNKVFVLFLFTPNRCIFALIFFSLFS